MGVAAFDGVLTNSKMVLGGRLGHQSIYPSIMMLQYHEHGTSIL